MGWRGEPFRRRSDPSKAPPNPIQYAISEVSNFNNTLHIPLLVFRGTKVQSKYDSFFSREPNSNYSSLSYVCSWLIWNRFVFVFLLLADSSDLFFLDSTFRSEVICCDALFFFINANLQICSVLDLSYRCMHGVSYSVFSDRENLLVFILFIFEVPYICCWVFFFFF